MKQLILFAGLSFISFSLFAQAQNQLQPAELVTDRPDQTESAATVPHGAVQLETGPYLFTSGKEDREGSYNNLLLRAGLLPWWELRLIQGYDGYRYLATEGELRKKGLSPLTLGTKVMLVKERGLLPNAALMYHISLPHTGSRAFWVEEPEHELRANFSHSVHERLELSYNLGVQWQEIRETDGLYTLSLGYDVSERVGVFAEVYGFLLRDATNVHAADAGITYLALPNLQLDASLGRGISKAAPDWLWSAGISWRIPH